VPSDLHAGYWTQQEFCDLLQVSDRTLRSWAAIGLPVEAGPDHAPRYPRHDAMTWALCYKVRSRLPGSLRALSIEEARRWHLETQFREWPEDFVLVPLDWDHPLREAMLRLAAAGREPLPEDDEE
jgi:hypothetical protein